MWISRAFVPEQRSGRRMGLIRRPLHLFLNRCPYPAGAAAWIPGPIPPAARRAAPPECGAHLRPPRAASVLRDHRELGKHQSAQSLGLLVLREIHLQRLGHIIQIRRAGHPPLILPQTNDLLLILGVKFVVDLAHDLLQQVLHGNKARGPAVLSTTIARWIFLLCISRNKLPAGTDSGTK